MNHEELRKLIAGGESETVEFKNAIDKEVLETAGKEAAGENLDFGGDMWKMIAWWEKLKKG